LHDKVGTLVETDTLASLLYYITTRVGSGEDPPPLSTSIDSARILAALYYIAQAVIVPAWAVDNQEVLDAITAAEDSIKGPHDTSTSSLWDGMFDSGWGLQATINANVDAAETAINLNVDNAETAIIAETTEIQETLAEGLTAEGGGNYYPGRGDVTLGTPVLVDTPQLITASMDGVVWEVDTLADPLQGLWLACFCLRPGRSGGTSANAIRYRPCQAFAPIDGKRRRSIL
jgi:hypothetical protein